MGMEVVASKVVVVVAGDMHRVLEACMDVDVVLEGWGLAEMVAGWNRYAVGIFLLWRCYLCGRDWSLVGVVRVVAAGMCPQAVDW